MCFYFEDTSLPVLLQLPLAQLQYPPWAANPTCFKWRQMLNQCVKENALAPDTKLTVYKLHVVKTNAVQYNKPAINPQIVKSYNVQFFVETVLESSDHFRGCRLWCSRVVQPQTQYLVYPIFINESRVFIISPGSCFWFCFTVVVTELTQQSCTIQHCNHLDYLI